MIELFALIGFVVVFLIGLSFIPRIKETKLVVLDENKIIKKFNKLIRNLGKRNIDTVKEELLELLDQYKICKQNQFEHANIQLTRAITDIAKQIISLKNLSNEYLNKAKEVKNNNGSSKVGARYLYHKDRMDEVIKKLEAMKVTTEGKKNTLLENIELFDSEYAIKKGEISVMIANSIEFGVGCDVDLKLNNLISEFQGMVSDQEAVKEVNEKMNHIEKEEPLAYDESKYIEAFNEL